MQLDVKRLAVFIGALILYYLFSPLLGLGGILGVAIASGLMVYLYTTRGFNRTLRQ